MNPGRLLTKDEILEAVWPDAVVEESNLAYHVFAIRKAIEDGSSTDRYIETIPKRGYRLITAVARSGDVSGDAADRQQLRTALVRGPSSERAVAAVVPPSCAELQRFQEFPWGRPAEPMMFSISPDSRHLLMAIQGADGVARLWIRTLSEAAPRPLLGSEGFLMPPAIWSPAGDAVAFANGRPLK